MSSIHFFTGENDYQLVRKKSLWIQEFSRKHGSENISRLEGKNLELRLLLDEVSASPFIAQKRLIVLEDLPKFEKEDWVAIFASVHPDAILLIVSPKPDKRLSAVKFLLENAKVENFRLFSPAELISWVQDYLRENGAQAAAAFPAYLVGRAGSNQMLMEQEINKLSLFAAGRQIEIEDARQLSLLRGDEEVWELLDHLCRGDARMALDFIARLMERGVTPGEIWGIFLWMLSSFAPVFAALEHSASSQAVIAKSTGVSFTNLNKLLPFLKKAGRKRVMAIVESACEFDLALKTGVYRSTAEDSSELRAIIDRMIFTCCGYCR